jgi:hypothetical protein
MNLPNWLSRLLRRPPPKVEQAIPCSIVLLLQEFHFFTADELRAAGEVGWRKRFDGVEDPMYFVVQKGGVTMIKAGTFVFHVLHSPNPYLADVESVANQLPQPEQRKAWQAHTAWVSVDSWNLDLGKREAYAAIARLAMNMADSNCTGVYLPGEEMFMPNDGTADEGMRFILAGELPFK